MQLGLGIPVRCGDEIVGTVADVVIHPETRRLTHLVVETRDKQARLVPVELVVQAEGPEGAREVSLTCTPTELSGREPIRVFAYLDEAPAVDASSEVGITTLLSTPSYGVTEFGDYDPSMGLIYDRVPKGEAEIRRSSAVFSRDDHYLGHVDGFVVDDERVTHVVLARGHLWGTRDITIPIDAVDRIDTDSVTLNLSKEEVGALPALHAHRFPFA
jgi:sporulation protein YlmC with PRC-barrel domain